MNSRLISGMSVLGAMVVAAIAVETTLLLSQDNSKPTLTPVVPVPLRRCLDRRLR